MDIHDETRPLFFESNRPRHSIEMTPGTSLCVCARARDVSCAHTYSHRKKDDEQERIAASQSGHCLEPADI